MSRVLEVALASVLGITSSGDAISWFGPFRAQNGLGAVPDAVLVVAGHFTVLESRAQYQRDQLLVGRQSGAGILALYPDTRP